MEKDINEILDYWNGTGLLNGLEREDAMRCAKCLERMKQWMEENEGVVGDGVSENIDTVVCVVALKLAVKNGFKSFDPKKLFGLVDICNGIVRDFCKNNTNKEYDAEGNGFSELLRRIGKYPCLIDAE